MSKNILVMQTGGWIGDMILLTPALRALRSAFPESHIEILVNPLVREFMERNPYLDGIIVYDKRGAQKGIRQMRRMADKLRAKQFDTGVILHPNSVRSAILSFMAGIPERIGVSQRGRGFFLTAKVKRRNNIHEVQRYLDIVSPIAGADQDAKLEFWGLDGDDELFAEHILAGCDVPVIGMNPCTTWPSKQWPVERFARLADLVSEQLGAQVVLTGTKKDIHIGNEIMRLVSSKPLNLIGRTTLWQLGALISRCRFYVTNDSGPMHISAAVGTPTIALFGPTDPVRHAPFGAGHTVVRKDTRCSPCYKRKCKSQDCMRAIQVEDVMEVMEVRVKHTGQKFVN